jgi:LemA protein
MNTPQLIIYSSIFLVLISIVYAISIYNEAQRLFNIIPEAESNISVLITKRNDLISKLITIVDSYDLHESSISENVASEFGGGGDTKAVVQRLASLRMAFPELKSNTLYNVLMDELANVETEITSRREKFNISVRLYNTLISQFPANILLSPFSFQTVSYLSDDDLI